VLARAIGAKAPVFKFGEKGRELRGHVNGGKSLLATSAGTEGADKAMEDRYGQLWDFTLVPRPPSATRVPSPPPAAPPLLVWIRRDLVESRSFTIDDCILTSLRDNLLVPIRHIKLQESVGEEGNWPSLSQIADKVLMADGGRGRGRGKAGRAKRAQWRNPP
jgi:hypothetical protein